MCCSDCSHLHRELVEESARLVARRLSGATTGTAAADATDATTDISAKVVIVHMDVAVLLVVRVMRAASVSRHGSADVPFEFEDMVVDLLVAPHLAPPATARPPPAFPPPKAPARALNTRRPALAPRPQTPGISELLLRESLKVEPLAALSRAAAGLRNDTLIVNLPGRPKAVRENLRVLLPILPHALLQLATV